MAYINGKETMFSPLQSINILYEGGKPIEIDTLDNSLLTAENDGKVYKCDDKLYQVEKIKSLKGLTIKFNEHITPCPVIGEDDVFECSGVPMGDDFPMYENRPDIIAIRKANDAGVPGTIISFTLPDYDNYGARVELFYSSDNDYSKWLVHDGIGNANDPYAPAVVYNFNCPALNENPEFIEWVFANGKVYPNFETANDIESFKINQPFLYRNEFYWFFLTLIWEINGNMLDGVFDVGGQYTVSFSLNGELITKTFTNARVHRVAGSEDLIVFSNGEDSLTIGEDKFDDMGYPLGADLIYNNIVIEDEPTFTVFNGTYKGCRITDNFRFLSFILSYTSVSGEYINGLYFVEYEIAEAEDKPVWNGTDLKGTTWLLNNTVEPFHMNGFVNIVGVAYDDTHTFGGNQMYCWAENEDSYFIRLFHNNDQTHNPIASFPLFSYDSELSTWTCADFYMDDELGLVEIKEVPTNNIHLTIHGGSDTTTPFVIDWFKQNGKLISADVPEWDGSYTVTM
jgi:hypothetical protein